MRSRAGLLLLCLALSACSTGGAGRGGLYVYLDEQGNLVTGQIGDEGGRENAAAPPEPSSEPSSLTEPELTYTPAPDDAAELPEQQQERFVTYVDGDGQVTRQRVDLASERQARDQRAPDYDLIGQAAHDDYLETVTPVAADCCQALLENAVALRPGQEVLLRFSAAQAERVRVDGRWLPARVITLRDDVASVRLLSFKQRGQYLHPQLLVLDDTGLPVLQVNNVFTRRFPETWSRYAYIDGTLPREPGQRYLVVYLGYFESGLPGLVREPDSELAIEGSVVVRGY